MHLNTRGIEDNWTHQCFSLLLGYIGREGYCNSRMCITNAKGNGGEYLYMFCLGRHRKRTDCKQKYVLVDEVALEVIQHYQKKVLEPNLLEAVNKRLVEFLDKDRRETEEATRLVEAWESKAKDTEETIRIAARQAGNCAQMYRRANGDERRGFNQAFYEKLYWRGDAIVGDEIRPEFAPFSARPSAFFPGEK